MRLPQGLKLLSPSYLHNACPQLPMCLLKCYPSRGPPSPSLPKTLYPYDMPVFRSLLSLSPVLYYCPVYVLP